MVKNTFRYSKIKNLTEPKHGSHGCFREEFVAFLIEQLLIWLLLRPPLPSTTFIMHLELQEVPRGSQSELESPKEQGSLRIQIIVNDFCCSNLQMSMAVCYSVTDFK